MAKVKRILYTIGSIDTGACTCLSLAWNSSPSDAFRFQHNEIEIVGIVWQPQNRNLPDRMIYGCIYRSDTVVVVDVSPYILNSRNARASAAGWKWFPPLRQRESVRQRLWCFNTHTHRSVATTAGAAAILAIFFSSSSSSSYAALFLRLFASSFVSLSLSLSVFSYIFTTHVENV